MRSAPAFSSPASYRDSFARYEATHNPNVFKKSSTVYDIHPSIVSRELYGRKGD